MNGYKINLYVATEIKQEEKHRVCYTRKDVERRQKADGKVEEVDLFLVNDTLSLREGLEYVIVDFGQPGYVPAKGKQARVDRIVEHLMPFDVIDIEGRACKLEIINSASKEGKAPIVVNDDGEKWIDENMKRHAVNIEEYLVRGTFAVCVTVPNGVFTTKETPTYLVEKGTLWKGKNGKQFLFADGISLADLSLVEDQNIADFQQKENRPASPDFLDSFVNWGKSIVKAITTGEVNDFQELQARSVVDLRSNYQIGLKDKERQQPLFADVISKQALRALLEKCGASKKWLKKLFRLPAWFDLLSKSLAPPGLYRQMELKKLHCATVCRRKRTEESVHVDGRRQSRRSQPDARHRERLKSIV